MTILHSGPVRADDGIAGGAFQCMNGDFRAKVTGQMTAGRMAVFDTRRMVRGGPPIHFHHLEDEWFQVVDGMFDIMVGDREYRLLPGDSVLGPAGTPHAFTNVSETGRLLLVFTPAGRMEAFFRQTGVLGQLSAERFAALSADYGMMVTGPPLPLRTS